MMSSIFYLASFVARFYQGLPMQLEWPRESPSHFPTTKLKVREKKEDISDNW